MSMPGGPSTLAGITYQDAWFMAFLLDLLEGSVDEVMLEAPGVDWAEGYTELKGVRTWYQMKLRSGTSSGTITSIADVLEGFKEGLERGEYCQYISMEGMQTLDVLATRAKEAVTYPDLVGDFLNTDTLKAAFKDVKDLWGVSEVEAHQYLKLIIVKTLDFASRKQWNLEKASVVLDGPPQTAINALGTIVRDMVHLEMKLGELEHVLRDDHGILRTNKPFAQAWRGEAKGKAYAVKSDFELLEQFSTALPVTNYDRTNWRIIARTGNGTRHEYDAMIGKLNDLAEAFDGENVASCKASCANALTELSKLKEKVDLRELKATKRFTGEVPEALQRVRQLELEKRGHHVWTYHGTDPEVEAAIKASSEYEEFHAVEAEVAWVQHELDLLEDMEGSIRAIEGVIDRRG